MIHVKICGGLGNQMFQYAMAYFLSKDGYDVKIDPFNFSGKSLINGFELERLFYIEIGYSEINSIKNLKDDNRSFISRVKRYLIGRRKTHILEKEFSFTSLNNNHVYLDGYWQNMPWLKDNRSQLRKLFKFNSELSSKNERILNSFKEETTISVHVRRGDYLMKKNSRIYAQCTPTYYLNAMDYFNSKYLLTRFLVFSNDSIWCKEFFKDMQNVLIIDWNQGAESYQDMIMMSKCKHNIIANSTFSWWGAYLNSEINGEVICPEKWFISQEKTKDIYIPDNFILMKN